MAESAVATSFGAADLLELDPVRPRSSIDAVSLGTLTPPLARVDPRTSGGLCTERQVSKTVSAGEHCTTHKCGRARTANSMGLHRATFSVFPFFELVSIGVRGEAADNPAGSGASAADLLMGSIRPSLCGKCGRKRRPVHLFLSPCV